MWCVRLSTPGRARARRKPTETLTGTHNEVHEDEDLMMNARTAVFLAVVGLAALAGCSRRSSLVVRDGAVEGNTGKDVAGSGGVTVGTGGSGGLVGSGGGTGGSEA